MNDLTPLVQPLSIDEQLWHPDGHGNVITRLETRHAHGVGVDSRGDIYAGLTVDRSVDKFVRVR